MPRKKTVKKTPRKTDKRTDPLVEVDLRSYLTPLSIFISVLISTIVLSTILIVGLHSINSNIKNYGVKGANTDSDNTADTAGDTADQEPTQAKTSIDDDPVLGNKDKAKIAIVEFSDYECPFCKSFHDNTFKQIVKDYIDTDKAIFVYRDLPLSFHEPAASKEAMATECVDKLAGDSKYYEFADLVFANTGTNGDGMSDDKLLEIVGKVGVSKDDFQKCLDSEEFKDEIQKDSDAAGSAGINGTPGFVVGVLDENGNVDGEIVSGAQPYSVFKAAIEAQLERAK